MQLHIRLVHTVGCWLRRNTRYPGHCSKRGRTQPAIQPRALHHPWVSKKSRHLFIFAIVFAQNVSLFTKESSCFERVVFVQTLALQAHYSWWSHLKETALLNGERFFTLTVTRPSLREAMVLKRPATPPETTAHTTASAATPTWCPCLRWTRLAAAVKERFPTIPPVSRRNDPYFSSVSGLDAGILHLHPFSAVLSRGCGCVCCQHRHAGDHLDGFPWGRAVPDPGCGRPRRHPL